jgi:predicted TIM-barrel fold metal-dependent hydrolase
VIVDGQLHEPGLQRSWDVVDETMQHAALDAALRTLLGAIGVDGAVLHPLEDVAWAHHRAESEPDRFVVVPMVGRPLPRVRRWDVVDLDAPDLEGRLSAAAARPGLAGFRCVFLSASDLPFERGSGYDTLFRFCADRGLPLASPFAGDPDLVADIAREFPGVPLVLDQMALYAETGGTDDSWVRLPPILDLARYQNVFVKLTGLPSLSRAAFPYDDIQAQVRRVLDEFGADRCMWASDISYYQGQVGWANRFPALVGPYPGKHTYAQSLAFLRDAAWITPDEKRALLGGTARRVFASPAPAPS